VLRHHIIVHPKNKSHNIDIRFTRLEVFYIGVSCYHEDLRSQEHVLNVVKGLCVVDEDAIFLVFQNDVINCQIVFDTH